jgi:tetratricopeptide (TPR) repeat protein
MPAAQPRQPRWLGFGVAALAAISLGLGWWLGQRQGGGEAAAGANPGGLQREVEQLRAQWESGEASQAEQQRLLELLVALDRRSEATPLLERLADQDAQRWSLRLLLAELRRDQGDLPGAERELRQHAQPAARPGGRLQLMALIQLESGRSAEARSQLEAALQRATSPALKPEAMAIGLVLANVLQRTGQPGKAEAELIRLGTRFPSDPRPLLARAMLQQERGNTNAAQQVLAEARSRQSDPKAQEQLDQVAAAWGMAALKAPASTPTPAPPAGVENP